MKRLRLGVHLEEHHTVYLERAQQNTAALKADSVFILVS